MRLPVLALSLTLGACSFDASGTGSAAPRRDSAVVLDEEDVAPIDVVDSAPDDTGTLGEAGVIFDATDDSPLPGCALEYYGGHDYLLCELNANWDQARTSCQLAGYDLAVINDKAEHDWLVARIKVKSKNDWHIGLSDRADEGKFVWVDGSAPSFTSWASWQPDNWLFDEDCTVVRRDGSWNDVNCGDGPREAFVCESK